MRKFMMMGALGCLAMATAADAQLAIAGPTACAYNAADHDLVVEVARLQSSSWSGPALA